MDYFAQQLINGLVLGSIYGLIAIGYTMVYGIVGMINFAHGDIFMIGGFIALISFLILVSLGLTFVPVILLVVLLVSMAITALYGWTVERIAYRPLRHSFRLAPMLSAIGMSFVLMNYAQVSQGARVKPVPPIITGGYTLGFRGGSENLYNFGGGIDYWPKQHVGLRFDVRDHVLPSACCDATAHFLVFRVSLLGR